MIIGIRIILTIRSNSPSNYVVRSSDGSNIFTDLKISHVEQVTITTTNTMIIITILIIILMLRLGYRSRSCRALSISQTGSLSTETLPPGDDDDDDDDDDESRHYDLFNQEKWKLVKTNSGFVIEPEISLLQLCKSFHGSLQFQQYVLILESLYSSIEITYNSKELPDGPEPRGQNCRLWAQSENVPAGLLQVCTNIHFFGSLPDSGVLLKCLQGW